MILVLSEHEEGIVAGPGRHIVYDLARDAAYAGETEVDDHALLFEVVEDPGPGEWLLRCDRVDFPPASVAYRHVHPGPGLRRILHGELTIDRDGDARTYRAGDWWYEDANDPILASASTTEETAFVRVLLLPAEWAGKRTIRYLDPADEEKPKLQRARILIEVPV